MAFPPSHSFADEDELLLRQVHPSFIHEGRISSQVFRLTSKDAKKISVNRQALISPEEAFKLHTKKKNLQSQGVWGISVSEVRAFPELLIHEDPISELIEDPSHCLIDFSEVSPENKIKSISSKLADKARARGCLYQEQPKDDISFGDKEQIEEASLN